ncbi:excisionase [Neptuniibacter sp.]|uniref:excisionase n=1 Tax=Neptuniibacter sp. TaxID=1962643 RepID=UPI0026142E68|nr:excisionase [Neptuniibacter sp.]MCP4596185.1 hypothetical protein [Neptuniibacter sp.]
MKIPLMEWWERHYSKPVTANTLRKYAREGRFSPEPEIVAGCYMVDENATLKETRSRSRLEMLKKAAAMKSSSTGIDISDLDPAVLEITGHVA